MVRMDHKPTDELLTELDEADPAEAPELADAVADQLERAIDDGAEPAPPA